MTKLTGPVIEPANGAGIDQVIILCHGLGPSGADLIKMIQPYANVVPRTLVAAPEATGEFMMGNNKLWFPVEKFDMAAIADGVKAASVLLDEYITALLKKYKVKQYVLLGFSQGAAVALYTGLRHHIAPMGIISLAGGLAAPETLATELKNRVPVLIGHGEKDTVVPVAASHLAEKVLRSNNVPVYTVYEPDLGHNIGKAELNAARIMLGRLLSRTA